MKNINLILFSIFFTVLLGFAFNMPMMQFEYNAPYKLKKKMDLTQRADGWAKIRTEQLSNINTGKVESLDWYTALDKINALKSKGLSSRGGSLTWEQQGPDQVSGRTRGFIFDKTKEGRVYSGGVSGGIFVSEDLGQNWKEVPNMADSFPIMSIGCMTQSKSGDIYAGTGEFWGNTPNGSQGSQFYGNGIYKKEAGQDNWTLLRSTIVNPLTIANNTSNFRQVVDIICDPDDNNVVYAGTHNGLYVSNNGGGTWTKLGTFNTVVGQVKIAIDGTIYISHAGKVFKSTNKGVSWTDIIGSRSEYTAESNGHVRIGLSKSNANKLYVCGIDRNSDLKYVIKTTDGGGTWEFLGKGDVSFNPLCNDLNGVRACQGWYDLCLAVHPKNDDLIFLGGAPTMWSWSQQLGWVQMSSGYSPAVYGVNQVHADKHDFAFHPTNTDTMVVVTDGGPFISYNSTKAFPNVTWKPIYTKYNITQFYDVAVNKYGELLGGAQDNGTQFVTLRGANSNLSFELQGGDGFDSEISASNDGLTAFTSTYNGGINRTADLTTNIKSIASGCVAQGTRFQNVGFFSKMHLAESILTIPNEKDSVDLSILFVFDQSGNFTMSNNAIKLSEPTAWTFWSSPNVGVIMSAHQSKNLDALYICGTSGIKKTTSFKTNPNNLFVKDLAAADQPCLKKPSITWQSCTGSGLNSISDVYVDQSDNNHVIAVQFGFGGSAKVFESTDGLSFVSKQGNLPIMPVYSCAIDPINRKHVVVATEFGIWETEDISVASPVWVEANTNIGRVPVFKLRVNYLRDEACPMIYAGTHGRGFYRAPFPFNSSCNYKKIARQTSGVIDPLSNIKAKFDIYPNPTSDKVNVTFSSNVIKNYTLSIYDMNGRIVKSMKYKTLSGDNIITTDISALQNGNYIIRLEDDKNVIGGKIMTKN